MRTRDGGAAPRTDELREPPPVSAWSALRPLLLRLHFCAGVLVAPFVLVAAVSGGLYALSTPLERLLHADQLVVDPAGTTLSLAEQVRAAQAVTSVHGLVGVRPAPAADASTRVLFDDGTLGASTLHAVFVDPGTGRVLGQQPVYGTSGALPVRTWVAELHRSLHLGEVGRHYSELAASWLWVVALGGLLLWLGRPRRPGAARARAARSRTRSRHGVLGLWLLVGLLLLSATGLTWSRWAGAHVTDARTALGWDAPTVRTVLDAASPSGTGGEHAHHGTGPATPTPTAATTAAEDVDAVLAAARSAGLTSTHVEVRLPALPGRAWTVAEVHRAFPTQVDEAAVHPETLEVVDVVRFEDHPLMAKLARWGVDLHMGTLFGLVNQLALAALATGVVVLVLLGYRMWWQRRPRSAPVRRPGAARPRGAWRLLPRWAVGLLVLATAAVGWSLPLFGVSLAAFLLLDAALGRDGRRRDAAGPRGAERAVRRGAEPHVERDHVSPSTG